MLYAYSRVSTARQADEGESLSAQDHRLAGYAMMLGLQIDECFMEKGVSGSVPLADRPEGSRLLAQLQPGDRIVCCKLDRCFRSALDALEVLKRLKAQNVELHLIDMGGNVCGDGVAKLVFTILSAVAEAERDRIRERISEVKRFQRKDGHYLGGVVPFGFEMVDGKITEHEIEQQAIRLMQSWRGEGFSLRAISNSLATQGFKLSHSAVGRVLARSESAG